MRTSAWNGRQSSKRRDVNDKTALEAVFCCACKKKPTADAVGKDNSGWMFTDCEGVCRPVGKKQRSRREASESVHLIELNERKLVVTDGLGNKLFHH